MSTRKQMLVAALVMGLLMAMILFIQQSKINELSEQLTQLTVSNHPAAADKPSPPPTRPQIAGSNELLTTPGQTAPSVDSTIIFSNLEKIRMGARQYMDAEGVTEVNYEELTGKNPKGVRYMPDITPVNGKDYSDAVIYKSGNEIIMLKPDGGMIIFK